MIMSPVKPVYLVYFEIMMSVRELKINSENQRFLARF